MWPARFSSSATVYGIPKQIPIAETPQLLTLNLGSGQGHSVLEVAAAFEAASGCPVPYELVARRPGDAASSVADPALAAQRLGWRTRRGLAEMCRDSWAWHRANPCGYAIDEE